MCTRCYSGGGKGREECYTADTGYIGLLANLHMPVHSWGCNVIEYGSVV